MTVNKFQIVLIIIRLAIVSVRDTVRLVIGAIFVKKESKRSFSNRIVHYWARAVLRILRVRYKILNPGSFEFTDDRPYIIMSNHLSHFDIPLLYETFPGDVVAMISKKEIFRIPVFGRGMILSGCVSIDRENKRQALKDLKEAQKVMLEGVRLWVAPEGTRSSTGKMGVFKKGGFKVAMNSKAIIVPLTIIGSNNILPTKTFNFSFDEEVEIHIGEPIDAAKYQDVKKLMSDTFDVISSKL